MATETSVLTGVEPRSFWAHFETLTTIARPSREEGPVIEHHMFFGDHTPAPPAPTGTGTTTTTP